MTRFRPVPLTWHYCHTLEGETHLVPLLNPKATNLSPQMLGESDQPQQDEDREISWLGGNRHDRRRRRSVATAHLTEKILSIGQQWSVPVDHCTGHCSQYTGQCNDAQSWKAVACATWTLHRSLHRSYWRDAQYWTAVVCTV